MSAPSSLARRRAARAQVFVADLDRPRLEGDQAHHLARVLRLRDGETVVLADGQGSWRLGTVDGSQEGGLGLTDDIVIEAPPAYPVTVCFVPVKAERPEFVVQKCTELGVDRIVVAPSARSVVRYDAKRSAQLTQRLVAVSLAAAAQSRRVWLPQIEVVDGLDRLDGPVAVADPDGRPLRRDDRCLVIGPEGGLEDDELASCDRVVLSDAVLRAETAAIAAAGLLTALRADLVNCTDWVSEPTTSMGESSQ